MKLFDFFKKEVPLEEKVEKEYRKTIEKVQAIDGGRCSSLVHDMKEYAEQTCQPQKGDDLLAKKDEFMRIYTLRAHQWRCYSILTKKRGISTIPLWVQKWRNYEQNERLKARKRWQEMLARVR